MMNGVRVTHDTVKAYTQWDEARDRSRETNKKPRDRPQGCSKMEIEAAKSTSQSKEKNHDQDTSRIQGMSRATQLQEEAVEPHITAGGSAPSQRTAKATTHSQKGKRKSRRYGMSRATQLQGEAVEPHITAGGSAPKG